MASPVAESLFWIAGAACAVAQTAIVKGVVARDGGSGTEGGAEPAGTAPAVARPSRTAREAAWAILPGLGLALALAWTWRTMHLVPQPPRPTDATSLIAPPSGA